jgi:hypothetical protein
MGLEGIVSKHLESAYGAGPSKHWIKIKNPKSPACFVRRMATGERPQNQHRQKRRPSRCVQKDGRRPPTTPKNVSRVGEQLTGLADARLGFARQSFAHRRQLLEPGFVCQACGTRGANLRPDFEGNKKQHNRQRPGLLTGCVNRGHKAIPLFRKTTQRVAYAAPNWRALLTQRGSNARRTGFLANCCRRSFGGERLYRPCFQPKPR